MYQKKQENRTKMAEELRERQAKLMEINDLIRKHDLRGIKNDEMDRLKGEMTNLRKGWDNVK
jgi:hypothetical protein